MKCKKEIVSLIHKYFDEEINENEQKVLLGHIGECDACKKHFNELKKSIAFVQSSSHITAPPNFTEMVMKQLPQQKKSVNWKKWLKNNPFLVAASLFILFMASSIFSSWLDNGNDLQISGNGNMYIDKERNVVVVPAGEVVEGNLLIKNGDIQIDGKVEGNVTVLNGQKYLASTGEISGNIEEIDQALEWIWYNIKSFFAEAVNVFGQK